LIQIADLTSVLGVSGLLVFANTSLTALLNRYGPRPWGSTFFLLCCVAGAVFYGQWRMDEVRALEGETKGLHAAVVQGNVDQFKKWDPSYQDETLRRYEMLSLAAVRHSPSPQLVVWPETAAPFLYGVNQLRTSQLEQLVRRMKADLLFGGPAMENVDGNILFMNRAYLLDGHDGHVLGQYTKQHLVPFGEYVPLQKILFFVKRLVQAVGTFVPGNEASPIDFRDQGMGVLICYEVIFPELARRTVNLGAQFLVNLTNDAWFGNTSAPYQHLQMAQWRAVELRVPLIRAANTGISTIIDSVGGKCGNVPLNDEGFLVCSINPIGIKTFYAVYGDWFAWMCLFVTLGGIAYELSQYRLQK
jgi:apolipoprotein N-acyltransferase